MMGSMASQGQQQELLCVEYKKNNYSYDWFIQQSHPCVLYSQSPNDMGSTDRYTGRGNSAGAGHQQTTGVCPL